MTQSVEKQVEMLRRSGSAGLVSAVRLGVQAIAVGLALAAWLLGSPVLLIPAAFVALVASSVAQSGPHLRNAARALDEGVMDRATVEIVVEEGGDSPTYRARIHDPVKGAWEFEFVPQGWWPVAGLQAADAFRLGPIEWPVLVIVADGLVFPRQAPIRLPGRP